jgi:hypothetical protein
MKKTFAILVMVIFAAALFSVTAWGQSILVEDFNYSTGQLTSGGGGANVSGGTWISSSGTANYIPVSSGSLSYTAYPSSGNGNKVDLISTASSAEDVRSPFTKVTSGTVYASFLLSVTNTTGLTSGGDYFFAFKNETGTNTGYKGLIYIKTLSSGFTLGVRPGAAGAATVFSSTQYNTGTTYLVVIKYEIIAGSNNDVISLWINPSLSGSEPAADLSVTADASSAEPDGIEGISMRQGANGTPNASLDGFRVATAWSQAPLPVELTSFTALARGGKVELNWNTATEVNTYGFEIQRTPLLSPLGEVEIKGGWAKVGFVEGHGTTNAPQNYSFSDNSTLVGKYSYRLKQIDRDGKFEYSKEVEAAVALAQNTIVLGQNYPNPFNPETSIEFAVPTTGYTTLKVYNMLGEEVSTLVNGNVKAGVLNRVSFKGGNFASGLYFYTLRSGNFVDTKKMLMVK